LAAFFIHHSLVGKLKTAIGDGVAALPEQRTNERDASKQTNERTNDERSRRQEERSFGGKISGKKMYGANKETKTQRRKRANAGTVGIHR